MDKNSRSSPHPFSADRASSGRKTPQGAAAEETGFGTTADAAPPTGHGYAFSGFRLEPGGLLFRGRTQVQLSPRELAALRLLLARAGQMVSPLELRKALWGDVHVTADSVLKCLSSLRARLEPADCIQTVYKRGYRLSAAVERYAVEPAGPMVRLVVSPFATGQGVPEYLGLAIAEETAARLTRARPAAVLVLARDSVFTLARRGQMAQEIGVTLKADFVLTGSLRALPPQFRLGVEMIRVADGVQIWAEDMLVERSQAAGLEAELASRLSFRLNAEMGGPAGRRQMLKDLSGGWPGLNGTGPGEIGLVEIGPGRIGRSEDGTVTAPGTISIAAAEDENSGRRREAREILERAHYEWQTLQRHRMQDGLQQLLRAVELDPWLTTARVELANLCVAQAFCGFMAPAVAAGIAQRAAEQVPGGAGGTEAMLPALGWFSFHFDRDLAAAQRAFSLSAHLPHDPWTTRARAMLALSRHRFAEAKGLLRGALELDPYSAWLHGRLAWALHLAGEAEESVEQARRALALFPEEMAPNLYGALILAYNGEAKRAAGLAEELERRMPYFDPATAVHAYALACCGAADQARALLEQLDWLGRERFVVSGLTPAVYVALDEPDAALAALRRSMEERCPWFFQMLADPRLKPLAGRPEFAEMREVLTRMEQEAARAAEPG